MSDPVVMAPGADDNGLACMLAELLREAAGRPDKQRDLAALDGEVAIVALDADVALTLDFRSGRVTVHDGVRPEAAVRIETDAEGVTALARVPLRYGLPDVVGSAEGRALVRDLLRGRVRLHGALTHPLLLLRLTRLLSVA